MYDKNIFNQILNLFLQKKVIFFIFGFLSFVFIGISNLYSFGTGYGGGCFIEGTLISTPEGDRPIEELSVGDKVLCFDEKGTIYTSFVEKTYIHEAQKIIRVKFWGGEFVVTPIHYVLNDLNTFEEIGKFVVGAGLIDMQGKIRPIKSIEQIPDAVVYNITVAKYHTYFANGISVHNFGGGGGSGGKYDEHEIDPFPTLYLQNGDECGIVTAHMWMENIKNLNDGYVNFWYDDEEYMQDMIVNEYNWVSGSNGQNGNCPVEMEYYDEMMQEMTQLYFASAMTDNPTGYLASKLEEEKIGGVIHVKLRWSDEDHIVFIVGARTDPDDVSEVQKIKIFDPNGSGGYYYGSYEYYDLEDFWLSNQNSHAPVYFNTGQEAICSYQYGIYRSEENQQESELIKLYDFEGIFPNPGDRGVSIHYSIVSNDIENVRVDIYNIRGQLESTLFNGKQGTGDYNLQWDGNQSKKKKISSGIYFAKVVIDNNIYIKHFTIVK